MAPFYKDPPINQATFAPNLGGFGMYFKNTGVSQGISHRHPFHGVLGNENYYEQPDLYSFDVSAMDKRLVGIQGWEDYKDTLAGPLTKGLITGVIAYITARSVGIEGSKAKRLGIVMGGLEAAALVLGGFIKKELVPAPAGVEPVIAAK
jgi:hypothetical protein